ncbi:Mss4-like protein [Alternaria rosae]|uniref:Mss4-like protein n=1 Tax=Alternaria rosae TaxID=1187941 RepID=UPI001E8EA1F2|nr:Mss4-like protein [Alternaria rosae]KAH6883418.1 Mss4-like protein [Alternaria rosae]
MSTSKPFPALSGGCVCNTIRYRLLTAPLYCYACHCMDCQKQTGSAFYLSLNIELYNIEILSPTKPSFLSREVKPGIVDRYAECPQCRVQLWASNHLSEAVVELRVGTLDFPSLMEPDIHIHVESKLDWVVLPKGAKMAQRGHDYKQSWPKSSLKRLDICLKRAEEVKKRRAAAMNESAHGMSGDEKNAEGVVAVEGSGEGDKTPTAGDVGGNDDDEAEDQKFRETEKALLERLERLSLKLQNEEGTKKTVDTCLEDLKKSS